MRRVTEDRVPYFFDEQNRVRRLVDAFKQVDEDGKRLIEAAAKMALKAAGK